ncbi:Hypothetical predicted protein [Mytilus galloprovincialis]|uniref:Uncharacterized protein n=1 Tax=Mytilus galloprovincialis TaxID=29158 RepID=A0A8B6DZL2_MYTGA|nr:Hypothetical predicted protein [Mytilus galloprovincialis]
MSKPTILPTKTVGLQPTTPISPKPPCYSTNHQTSSGEGETYSAYPKSADSPIDNPITTESTPSPQIQHLPKRTSIAATLLLLGRIPLEGEIHKEILKTFGNIIRNDKSVEREIAFRQLAMKDEKSESWFTKLHNLTVIHGLPSPYDIIENPPSKISCNRHVNNCINNNFLQNLKKEAKEKSSLKYINFNDSNIGTVHNIWKSSGTDPYSVNMAAIKYCHWNNDSSESEV